MTRDIGADLAAAGGLVRRAALLALGHRPRAITRAVRAGLLTVPRRGWLAGPGAPPLAVRAVALGGVLGGASALESYGIWVDDPTPLVVSCAPTSSRLPPLGSGEQRVWLAARRPSAGAKRWRVSVIDALLQYARDAEHDALIAAVDSALNTRLLAKSDLRSLMEALPARLRSIEREIDGAAMSGTETRIRLGLVRAGYHVESQVHIPTVGEADLLVDRWLIVEADSRKHHDGRDQQTVDRRRDGNAVLAGYGHERFMWSQARFEMDWVLSVVAARIRDGPPDRSPITALRARRAG